MTRTVQGSSVFAIFVFLLTLPAYADTPAEALAPLVTRLQKGGKASYSYALRQYNRQRCVWGTAEKVRNGILSLGDTYNVDEFVILTICSKFEARCRSYELLAKEFDLAPRGI